MGHVLSCANEDIIIIILILLPNNHVNNSKVISLKIHENLKLLHKVQEV